MRVHRALAACLFLVAALPQSAFGGDLFSSIDAVASELKAPDAARRRDAVDILDLGPATADLGYLPEDKRVIGPGHPSSILQHQTRAEIFCLISYLHLRFLVVTCFDRLGPTHEKLGRSVKAVIQFGPNPTPCRRRDFLRRKSWPASDLHVSKNLRQCFWPSG